MVFVDNLLQSNKIHMNTVQARHLFTEKEFLQSGPSLNPIGNKKKDLTRFLLFSFHLLGID